MKHLARQMLGNENSRTRHNIGFMITQGFQRRLRLYCEDMDVNVDM